MVQVCCTGGISQGLLDRWSLSFVFRRVLTLPSMIPIQRKGFCVYKPKDNGGGV